MFKATVSAELRAKLALWGLSESVIFGGIDLPVIAKIVGEKYQWRIIFWLSGRTSFPQPPKEYKPLMTLNQAEAAVEQERRQQVEEAERIKQLYIDGDAVATKDTPRIFFDSTSPIDGFGYKHFKYLRGYLEREIYWQLSDRWLPSIRLTDTLLSNGTGTNIDITLYRNSSVAKVEVHALKGGLQVDSERKLTAKDISFWIKFITPLLPMCDGPQAEFLHDVLKCLKKIKIR